jgi:hypothetical protein
LNYADDKKIAEEFLKENKATFPTILDTSGAANDVMEQFTTLPGMSAVPLSYLIDKEGKIFTGYYGGRDDHESLLLEMIGNSGSAVSGGGAAKDNTSSASGEVAANRNSFTALRGKWATNEEIIQQTDAEAIPAAAIYPVSITKGEITLQARIVSGEEGIRILFGYQKPEQYFVWNIGAEQNTSMTIEKWYTLDGAIAFYEVLNEPPSVSLQKEVWHSIRLAVDASAGTLDGYLDGNKILAFKTTQSIKGKMGLSTWKTCAEFRDVKIETQ